MSELPNNWIETEIGSLCSLRNGRAFKPSEWQPSGLPIVRIQNLNNPTSTYNYFQGEVDERNRLRGGELLFAWSGTPGTSFGAHVWRGGDAVLNQHIFRFDFDEALLDKRFFRSAINQKLSDLIDVAHGGVGLRHVTKGVFERTLVALPPRTEQTRISNQLDTLLTRIQSCNDRFDAIPALLKRFRQTVLDAATTGQLTEAWRLCNVGQVVAENIVAARLAVAGTRPTKAAAEFFANHQPAKSLKAELPETWLLTHIGMVGVVSNGSTPSRQEPSYWGGAIPWVSSGEVANGVIRRTREQITEVGFNNSSVRLLPRGTVLMAMIGEGKTRGQSAILDIDACINQNIAGVVPVNGILNSKYLWFWFRKEYENTRTKGNGSGPKALNCERVRELEINLPPLSEQAEIVRRIEALFALADRIEARCTAARAQSQRLTPLVLAKAFRGELVPQDPNDEPASELLARIEAAKTAAAPKKEPKRPAALKRQAQAAINS